MPSRQTPHLPPPSPEWSPDSTSSISAKMTPDADSDSDLEIGEGELGESFKMQRRSRDMEKAVEDDEDDDEGEEARGNARRPSSVQSFELYTPDEERAVVRKLDRRLVLFVALLYMLSFLDRSNIGNARIAGLEMDLNLDSDKYEWVITAFYIAYICFEWMSVLWKIVPAHIYVTIIVLSWGIVASLQSVATSFAGLLILRTLLGIGEAGFTGIPFYLSFFFKREELALRTGFFISAAPLATSFASTLAWAIISLGKYSPIASWRLLFLIEGFPSVLVAVIAWRTIPDSPATAPYLTTRQRKVAVLRLRRPAKAPTSGGLNIKEMLSIFLDPKSYLTAFMFFFTNMAFSSLPVFLPTIIHEMGHSPTTSQALSAPPYLLSFIIVILTAYLSDHFRHRSSFIIVHSLLSALGYASIALAGHLEISPWYRYAGVYPAAIGFFSVITVVITWSINNQESESRQGAGFAFLQVVGQCGPLVGTRLYPKSDAPLYVRGMGACAVAMGFVALLAGVLHWHLRRENARLDRGDSYDHVEDEEGSQEGEGLVGKRKNRTRKVKFRYML